MVHNPEEIDSNDPEIQALLFRRLMEHTADAIYFKDTRSRFIAVSRPLAQRFGFDDPQRLLGKTDFDFFGSRHAHEAYADEQDLIHQRKSIIKKIEHENWKDGRESWVSTIKKPLLAEDGKVIGIFGISSDRTEQRRTEQSLRDHESIVSEQNAIMKRELERARVIHEAMIPLDIPQVPGLLIETIYEPMEAIGGDCLAFYPALDGSLGFFIGDVTGHGVSAALYMALIKFLADQAARKHLREPSAYMNYINRYLLKRMPEGFVTAYYAFFERSSDSPEITLLLADAAHPAPLIFRTRDRSIETPPTAGNGALGFLKDYQSSVTRVTLNPGDRIYFFTDGILESCPPGGDQLGRRGFEELIRRDHQKSLRATLLNLMESLAEFREGAIAEDDVALVAIEVEE